MVTKNTAKKNIKTDNTSTDLKDILSSGSATIKVDKGSSQAKRELSLFKWRRRALACATLIGICALTVILVGLLHVLSTPVSIAI